MKHSVVLAYSATITVWFIVAITVFAELSKSFKALLTATTGHHWVTKSVLSVILFLLLYGVISKSAADSKKSVSNVYMVVVSAATGGLIIFGFFLWHFLVSL